MNWEGVAGPLLRAADDGRLAHAFIVAHAPEDAEAAGIWTVSWARALLCLERKTGAEKACENCESCRLTKDGELGVHPDTFLAEPEAASGYAVEQIRALIQRFSIRRSLSPRRVAWLKRAEALGGQGGAAGNALLKLLEEPRPDSFLILTTSRPEGLLATLRSRCQFFRLPRLGTGSVEAWESEGEWQGLMDWLASGARPIEGQGPRLPADQDSFWKEREEARDAMRTLYRVAWGRQRDAWAQAHDLEASRRVLDAFRELDQLCRVLEGYVQGPLQWLSFRSRVRLGF